MHNVVKDSQLLLLDLRNLLDEMRPNKCIDYFIDKAINATESKEHSDDLFVSHGVSIPQRDIDLLRQYVEVLLHLSCKICLREQLIITGGLITIMELQKIFKDDVEVKLQLCKILSNLSLIPNVQDHLFVTGMNL